jgi:hypothetical protein
MLPDDSIGGLLMLKAEANKKTLKLYKPSELLEQAFDFADPIARKIKDPVLHDEIELYVENQRAQVGTKKNYSDVSSFCDKILNLIDPQEIVRIKNILKGIVNF